MDKRRLTSHIILRSTAGRLANQSFSKSINPIADWIVDWFPIADSWDLETRSFDEDGLPLRSFIRCFIPRRMEHDEGIPIVCVNTGQRAIHLFYLR